MGVIKSEDSSSASFQAAVRVLLRHCIGDLPGMGSLRSCENRSDAASRRVAAPRKTDDRLLQEPKSFGAKDLHVGSPHHGLSKIRRNGTHATI